MLMSHPAMVYKNINIRMSENIKSAKGAFSYMKHEHITSNSAGMYCNMFILEALKCDQCGERGIFSIFENILTTFKAA